MDIYQLLKSYPNNIHYLNRYVKFILSRSEPIGYFETHHILPKSMFPDYGKEEWNLVRLTAREHYLAHWMLWKAFGNGMSYAFWMMNTRSLYGKKNSKMYSILREQQAKLKSDTPVSKETRQKMSIVAKNRKFSQETRDKLSKSRSGELNGMYGKSHSQETKAKMSERNKGCTGYMWINDGSQNKKMKREDPIPSGWTKGRIMPTGWKKWRNKP